MIKDIRNLFRLKRELNDTAIKDIRNLFKLKKENKAIKNRIIRDISKDNDEAQVMDSKSDNIEIMINDKPEEVIKNFFNHFFL